MTETAQRCKHGDPTCPCQDGLLCHYEPYPEAPLERGREPLRCPTTGIVGCEVCT